jgi:hypothetical protein
MATRRFVSLVAFVLFCQAESQSITVTYGGLINTVSQAFLCYNIDTGSIYNGFDFSDPKLQVLVKQLGPACELSDAIS